jgi:hypothetical protein
MPPDNLPASNECRDFAKQLVLYADAITAFSFVQALGFIYLLAHGDCFTKNVLQTPCLPIVGSIVGSVIYFFLVLGCNLGERSIFKTLAKTPPSRLVNWTWGVRYGIIILGLIFTLTVLWLVASSSVFVVDCHPK